MTRKDFRAIAECVRRRVDMPRATTHDSDLIVDVLRVLTDDLGTVFKTSNPGYDHARFMEACGL